MRKAMELLMMANALTCGDSMLISRHSTREGVTVTPSPALEMGMGVRGS